MNFDPEMAPYETVNVRGGSVPQAAWSWNAAVVCAMAMFLAILITGCRVTNVTVQWPISFGGGDATADNVTEQEQTPEVSPEVSVMP